MKETCRITKRKRFLITKRCKSNLQSIILVKKKPFIQNSPTEKSPIRFNPVGIGPVDFRPTEMITFFLTSGCNDEEFGESSMTVVHGQ